MNITIGNGMKPNQIIKAIEAKRGLVSSLAEEALYREPRAVKAQELELICVTMAELGFTEDSEYQDICERALELGYQLCPAEVGHQLILQLPKDIDLKAFVGMEPLNTSSGQLTYSVSVGPKEEFYQDGTFGKLKTRTFTDIREHNLYAGIVRSFEYSRDKDAKILFIAK